jgi:hypothetical protein
MILNISTIEDIKQKSGLRFDKAGDYGLLSMKILKDTGRSIGITTLKRLFNYINDDRKASVYTMNTIAIYLGYESWKDYVQSKNIDSVWGFDDDTIYINDLAIGTTVYIQYLNRKVTFKVIEHEGRKVLQVSNVENSSLKVGDYLYVFKIREGEFLEAEKVVRGSSIGNYKTNGEVSIVKISQ